MTLNELALDAFTRAESLPVSMREELQRIYARTVSILILVNTGLVDAREEARGRIEAFRRELDRAERALHPNAD